jgi:hypothetical protein
VPDLQRIHRRAHVVHAARSPRRAPLRQCAAATLAASRSSTLRPVICPSDAFARQAADHRVTRRGNTPIARSRARLCASVLPKPKPGSMHDALGGDAGVAGTRARDRAGIANLGTTSS